MLRGTAISQLALCISITLTAFAPLIAADKEKPAPLAVKGDKFFTQFSLFYEKNHHLTTNYRIGILVPINTEVEFVKLNKKTITVKISSYDTEVEFINVPDFSGETVEGIFKRTFGPKPVDLTGISETELYAIKRGRVEEGMSKATVLKSMGYPPRHKTRVLTLDQWRYWKSRFDTLLVSFENDKVVAVTD